VRALLWPGAALLSFALTACHHPGTVVSGSVVPDGGNEPATDAGVYKLVLTVSASGPGTVRASGLSDCRDQCTFELAVSARVVLSAVPDAGALFSGWGSSCFGTGNCELLLDKDRTVTAKFETAPSVPAPTTWEQPPNAYSSKSSNCEAGASDGSSHLALPSYEFALSATVVRFLDIHGAPAGRADGTYVSLVPQNDGFLVADNRGIQQSRTSQLFAIAGNGAVLGQSDRRDGDLRIGEDPLGGVSAVYTDPQGNWSLESYDARASLRWSVRVPTNGGQPRVFGTDRIGNTLVLLDQTPRDGPWWVEGVWVDHQGHIGPSFNADSSASYVAMNAWLVLFPRVGSGLFLSDIAKGHGWLRQFDSFSSQNQRPPDWLTSRPAKLHVVLNGQAYAFLEPFDGHSSNPCSQGIEIVASSGKSCGKAVFPIAPASCMPASIDIGYDGTVIQQLPFEMERSSGSGNSCTWRWWPGFFR
jgi:hypothetical protein